MKKSSAIAVAALVLATTVSGISGANAAPKAGGACSPANAKTTISKVSFRCTYNPATTVKKLTWVSQPCLDANASFKSANTLATSVASSYNGRISSATRLLGTTQRLMETAQKNVDKWSADLAAYLKAHPNAKTSGTETEKKNIATVEAGIERNKQRVIDLTANLEKLNTQIKDANDGLAKNQAEIDSAKALVTKACI